MAPQTNPVAEERFFKSLQTYLGRYLEVISGRNAYTVNKEKHAKMMDNDGMYLLLEKPPEEGMKQYYDKALILPANVAHAHFTAASTAFDDGGKFLVCKLLNLSLVRVVNFLYVRHAQPVLCEEYRNRRVLLRQVHQVHS